MWESERSRLCTFAVGDGVEDKLEVVNDDDDVEDDVTTMSNDR
jgi:hypothetical protein